MKIQPRMPVSMSAVTFAAFVLVATLGWTLLLVQLSGHHGTTSPIQHFLDIGIEILKVVVIAAAAAISIEKLLQREPHDEAEETLRRVNIKEIYPARHMAGELLLRHVKDPNTRSITIAGISLRDFLHPNGALFGVWNEITERLTREHTDGYQANSKHQAGSFVQFNSIEEEPAYLKRLQVRLLLLLPNSNEGSFRNAVEGENPASPGGIPFDIPFGLARVRGVCQHIYKTAESPFLQVRLYEHCPFSFIFATEREVFVEQYDYRNQHDQPALPLIVYESNSPQSRELQHSFNIVWQHASPADLLHQIGTASAIREGRVKNIFRQDHRAELTKRETDAVQFAPKESSIDILAVTGHFYTSNPSIAPYLQEKSRGNGDEEGIQVRFVMVNPISQQAILRAVADSAPPNKIRELLSAWDWSQHRDSNLYRDVWATSRKLGEWKRQGSKIEARLCSGTVSCAILLTKKQVFVEQYMYGRSAVFQPGFTLGGEYPVIEYDVEISDLQTPIPTRQSEVVEHQVIKASFDIAWNQFSMPLDDYADKCLSDPNYERNQFENNLMALRRELDIDAISTG